MKRAIQVIWVSILSLLVFIATSGYFTFQHYCSHQNRVKKSIFLELDCYNQLSFGNLLTNHTGDELYFNKEGCCKTERIFNKLNIPFEQTNFQKLKILSVQSSDLSSKEILIYEIELTFKDHNHPINGPPLMNKQHEYFTQQLKLSPPVC